jgi:hypothetical protein
MKVITIAREYGAGGSEVARKLADRLSWEVLGREPRSSQRYCANTSRRPSRSGWRDSWGRLSAQHSMPIS